MMTNFSSTRSKSRINQLTESPFDYAATSQNPSSDLSPHYMKATSCSEGKKGYIQASPHGSDSSFDSSDQSWSPSSSKSKRFNSNPHQVRVKSTCSSTLKDSKFPQQVELQSEGISKVKVCSYNHCSLNRRCDDHPSAPIKRVFRRRRVLKSQKSIRRESESMNANHFSIEHGSLIQDGGVFGVNDEAIEYDNLVEIVFGETAFPERSYQETIDMMRKYSQDTPVTSIEREWDESTSVSDDVESNDQSVTTPVFRNDEERDAENIKRELSENEPFAIGTRSLTDDLVEAKCSTECSSASASNARMELEESLLETDGKANPTEDVDPSVSAKTLHVAQLPKEKHRSMWSLIHRHMISDESTELDTKLTCGDDEEDHKDGGNKSCAAESSDSFSNFSARESMTTNQDTDNQEIEARKLLAIKLVREAIERILLTEVQDQSSDNQSVTSEVCTEENFKESDTKNEECDKASKSDEGNITKVNTGSTEEQKIDGQVANKAEKNVPKHWSNLKRWILLQRFIKELEKLRKFNPRKPRHLQLEPDPEAEKVNLKHQIEDERKSAEEWMLDYALQQLISQLAQTQKRKVGLLVTAFESVVPPRGSDIQVTFPKLKTRNEDNLQTAGKGNALVSNADNVRARLDKRDAEDDWLLLKNDETQENNMIIPSASECKATESITASSNENKKITEAEDGDGTSISYMNKQKHISMWHMISQHILSDVVSKVGNALLDGTDDEVDSKKTPGEMNTDNSCQEFSAKNDDSNHYGRSFSRNDAVNLIRESISQILKTPIQDDSSDTQSETGEEPPKADHTEGGEQNSTNSLRESLRHHDNQETKEHAANNSITESEFEPPKFKNWSKLKKLILLKRSIKSLERARKLNQQPPRLMPPTPDQEQEKVDLRNQMANERKKAEQWMLDNAVQHMVSKLTPARKARVAMLVEAFEAVVPLPEE